MQILKPAQGLFVFPRAPKARCGAKLAAEGQQRITSLLIIGSEDQLQMGASQKVPPCRLPITAHFRQKGALHFA